MSSSSVIAVQPQKVPKQSNENYGVFAAIIAAKSVLWDGEYPPHIAIQYQKQFLRMLGLWPVKHLKAECPFYAVYNFVVMTLFTIFVITITFDLYEVCNDVVMLGDDLVQLMGLYLILSKMWMFRSKMDAVEKIHENMTQLHHKFGRFKLQSNKIQRIQKNSFMFEISLPFGSTILALALSVAIYLQPLVSHQSLPFRAKFPFGLENPTKHPYCHALIYVLQCVCTFYGLLAVIYMDSVVCSCFLQTSVNIKILCIRLRTLRTDVFRTKLWNDLREIVEYHQHICSLTDDINECFYFNYIAQMGASTLMICLTAFEALVAKDQPMVALKFQLYMGCAFLQLFNWCFCGNRAYFNSFEIINAAFDVHEWYLKDPKFQRNLMFLIQRAQKPLEFRAKPLNGFNFKSFGSILSTSYSYFALLRTMNN